MNTHNDTWQQHNVSQNTNSINSAVPGKSSGSLSSIHPIAVAIKLYVKHLNASGYSPSTVASYSGRLEMMHRYLGDILLHHISVDQLEGLVITMLPPCQVNGATRNSFRYALRSFFGWAFHSGMIKTNPAEMLRIEQSRSSRTPAISPDETCRLFQHIRSSGDRLRLRDEALFATYAFTGIRRSAALQLRLDDYDGTSSLLRFNNKGGGTRQLPVVSALRTILNRYLTGLGIVPADNKGAYFFQGRNGMPLSPRQADKRFSRWRQAAGLRRSLTIHSFRSGLATALYAETLDLLLVNRVLGHAEITTTMRYIHREHGMRPALENLFSSFTQCVQPV